METKGQAHLKNSNGSKRSHVATAASDLLNEGRKLAHEIYEEGLGKVGEVQNEAKEYSDILVKKVKENPIASVLIAGGVGFLLSRLFRK
jgi:ElaB/YqjD/DUF883 family membrane-anchored ribosome-binding protein